MNVYVSDEERLLDKLAELSEQMWIDEDVEIVFVEIEDIDRDMTREWNANPRETSKSNDVWHGQFTDLQREMFEMKISLV